MDQNLDKHSLHRLVFLGLVIAFLVGSMIELEIGQSFIVKALALTVLIMGIPHGAIDPFVAKQLGVWNTKLGLCFFSLGYLAVAIAMVFVWLYRPTLTLTFFLLFSVWHFSNDWEPSMGRLAGLSISASMLTLPALFSFKEVLYLFNLLTGQEAFYLTFGMAVIAPVATLLAFLACFRASTISTPVFLEIFALLAGAAILPPLWFFLVYFCFLHSPRHLLRMLERYEGERVSNTALLFTVLTLILAIALTFLLPGEGLDEQLLRTIFIGLFALTVPHMILNEFYDTGEGIEI
ncbi:MAG: Brp/Blh family beta-carotene 15,15'-dioxygenase [Pseudomonadota bacterium]